MRRRAHAASDLITRINVTPIIDVALVLVIILLVTAPLLSVADLPVDLPLAHSREAEDERNVSITRTAGGELAIDELRVPPEAFAATLRARLARAGDPNVLVVLRADSSLPYAEARDLLAKARAAGARRLAVATRQQTKEQP
ncbi:MAG TPA: biopolymer transporter ExbD [Terriglobales bacterium]|nr:biopolymer transporter ExbD [Terriglobales bacterium]